MSSASENFGWHDWFKTVSNFGYLLEFGYPTDPLKADTDGDRYNDNEETLAKTDPNDPSEYPGSRAPVIRDHPASLSVTPGGNATLSVAAVSPGANILTNTGFEGSTGGWFNFGGTIGLTNTAFTGSNAVRLTRGEGYARLRYSNSLTLTSGVSYLATAMVRDSFAPTGDEFEFWNDNIHGPVLVSVRYPPALTNNLAGGTNWVKVRQLFTATNSGSGSIMLVAWNPPSNNTYVIDNFYFRPTTTNGLSYQWQRDGVAVSNATAATLSLTNLQTNQAGSYRVVVSSTYGSVTSEVATLTLGSAPVFTSTNSFSGTVGVMFSNTVTASGSTPIIFSGTNLPGGLSIATNGLITGTPTNAVTNTATLTASNSFGTTNQTVTFAIARGTPVISSWPTVAPITYGQALSNSILSGGVANPTGNFTWTAPTNRPNAGTNPASVTFTPTATNDYNSVTSTVSLVVNQAALKLKQAPIRAIIDAFAGAVKKD